MATKTVTGRITQVTISADKWDDVKNSGAGFFFIYMNALPKASPDGFNRVTQPSQKLCRWRCSLSQTS